MRVADVFDKPIACELCDFLQRPWFFEEMRRARDDLECFLLLREQIKKQRRQSGVVKCARHKLIPRTVTAAAATVGKKHERTRARRKMQSSRENCSPGLNLQLAHDRRESLV